MVWRPPVCWLKGVVNAGTMKNTSDFRRPKRSRRTAAQRAQLLAAFARSGLSAAAFARQHQLHYTTLCGWRQRQAQARSAPGFVQVELSSSLTPVELVLELGPHARVRITDADQLALAARLLQALSTPMPC